MGKHLLTSTVLLSSVFCALPQAQAAHMDDPWVLRARWIVVAPDDSSSPISTIGGTASVDTQIAPELDLSYFFTENIAVEAIAAVARHRARANGTAAGNVNLGEVSLLPPTVTLQWHFMPRNMLSPYLGVGVNYTYFFGVNPGPLAQDISYSRSFGAALQAGLNINFAKNWHFNLDVKKVFLDTDITVQLAAPPVLTTSLDIDPWIWGVGIGYRFG